MTYKIRSVSLMKLQGLLAPTQTAKDYLATKGFTPMGDIDKVNPRYYRRDNVVFDTQLHLLKPFQETDEWYDLFKQRVEIEKKMAKIEDDLVKEEIGDLLETKVAYRDTLL